MKETTLCGRPAGRKKTAKIEVLIEPEIKEEFMKIVSEEGTTASAELGRWIRQYIKTYQEDKKGTIE
ncbi:MAG: antitoxin [Clostridia bacterium]|nr:antitoxin [Clostridia bacterium]MBO5416077.1 antitoxin [Clostridia bacterium]